MTASGFQTCRVRTRRMGVVVGSVPDLERGRQAFAQAGWRDAYEALAAADLVTRLRATDLELLARAAYMLGRDDDYVSALERAYRVHLDAGAPMPAIRCAFWIGHSWLFRGQAAPAFGWFARAERLLDREQGDVAERGYVLVGEMLDHLSRGDAAGKLSPIVAGIVYCNTIAFCRSVYQLRRVREWTVALTRWCARQPDMVAHKGLCLVHRAEIMTLGGAWEDALEELSRVGEQFTQGALNRLACGEAAYREGEVRRLQGEFELAEEAYRKASGHGREPQPGMALMRLAQGRLDSAAATIRRAVSESSRGLSRVALL